MPEGDTLHRIARSLGPRLVGRALLDLEAPRLSVPQSVWLDREVTSVSAIGKYLVIDLSGGLSIMTHLRMDGVWHVYTPGEKWRRSRSQMVLKLLVESAEAVCFDAPLVRIDTTVRVRASLRGLGADILGVSFDVAEAVAVLQASPSVPLGVAIMDQSKIAGIGNVYKSELCFHTGLSPFKPIASFSTEQLTSLLDLTRRVMQANVTVNRRETPLITQSPAEHIRFQRNSTPRSVTPAKDGPMSRAEKIASEEKTRPLYVYERKGLPCFACGNTIAMKRQGDMQRSTYYCPHCQLD